MNSAQILQQALIRATGSSEGAKLGWEHRQHGFPSHDFSGYQFGGMTVGDFEKHAARHDTAAHGEKDIHAYTAHLASRQAYNASSNSFVRESHQDEETMHRLAEAKHRLAGQLQRSIGNAGDAKLHERNSADHRTLADNLKVERGQMNPPGTAPSSRNYGKRGGYIQD